MRARATSPKSSSVSHHDDVHVHQRAARPPASRFSPAEMIVSSTLRSRAIVSVIYSYLLLYNIGVAVVGCHVDVDPPIASVRTA